MHDCGRVDSRSVLRRLVEQFQCAGEIQVGILASQHGRRKGGEVLGHDGGRGFGDASGGDVLRIGDERKLTGPGSFDAGHSGYFSVRKAVFEARTESRSDFGKFHGKQQMIVMEAHSGALLRRPLGFAQGKLTRASVPTWAWGT